MRRRVLAACFAMMAIASRDAHAEGKKVLLVAPAATPFSVRVRAEIEAMGFEIELADTLSEQGTPTTIAAARVIESPPPRRIELWLVDATSGHLALRAVIQPAPGGDEATETVRASEQLRAFFQPLREPPPRPLPEPKPSEPEPSEPPEPAAHVEPPPPAPAPPAARWSVPFSMSASVALPLEPGSLGVDLALNGRWMATRWLGLGGLVVFPLMASTLRGPEGSASLRATLLGGELAFVLRPISALRITASAGMAAAWLRTSGAATPPFTSHEADVIAGVPFAGAEIGVAFGDRVSLLAGGRAGVSLKAVDVVFAGRDIATWGRPLGFVDAGLRVEFE